MKLLVLTSRTGLQTAYGAGAYERLAPILDEHAAARAGSGETPRLVPDDPESAALWGLPTVSAPDSMAFASAVRQVCGEEQFDAVLIVGGPEVVPHARVKNLVEFEPDKTIPSDNAYGCLRPDADREMVPDLPVGRLVGDATGNLDTLAAHVQKMAQFHRSRPVRSGACAVGCLAWTAATASVASTIAAGAVHQSPSYIASTATVSTLGVRRLYVNLHGFENDASWQGQGPGGMVPSILPDALASANLAGSVIFAANCYGAHVAGKTARTSCALQAAAGGALAFVGSTCFSFGAGSHAGTSALFADRLAQLFFEEHLTGVTAGQALRQGRKRYVTEVVTAHGVLPSREYKTAMQFILLGDPTL